MTPCPVCAALADREEGRQKYGWPEHDIDLPPAAGRLELARDFRPGSDRKRQLLRCPRCGAGYWLQTDHEYLANGTEEEQLLVRLAPARFAEILRAPAPPPDFP